MPDLFRESLFEEDSRKILHHENLTLYGIQVALLASFDSTSQGVAFLTSLART